jgi:hypothetical protein
MYRLKLLNNIFGVWVGVKLDLSAKGKNIRRDRCRRSSIAETGWKPVQITGVLSSGKGLGARLFCTCVYLSQQYHYLSIFHITTFRPNPGHPETDSQSFWCSDTIFSRSALPDEPDQTFFRRGPTPLSSALKVQVLYNTVLVIVTGPTSWVREGWRKVYSENLHNFHLLKNTISSIKPRNVRYRGKPMWHARWMYEIHIKFCSENLKWRTHLTFWHQNLAFKFYHTLYLKCE